MVTIALNDNKVSNKAFDLLEKIFGEEPAEQYTIHVQGNKGSIVLPLHVVLLPIADEPNLTYVFGEENVEISFTV